MGTEETENDVLVREQFEQVFKWIAQWSVNQKCQCIYRLLQNSALSQLYFLWTSLQSSCSRWCDPLNVCLGQGFKMASKKSLGTQQSYELPFTEIYTELDVYGTFHHRSKTMPSLMTERVSDLPILMLSNTQLDVNRSLSSHQPLSLFRSRTVVPVVPSHKKLHSSFNLRQSRNQDRNVVKFPMERSQTMPAIKLHENLPSISRSNSELLLQRTPAKVLEIHYEAESKLLSKWYNAWSDNQRMEFLGKLLVLSGKKECEFMSKYLSSRKFRDFLTVLPRHLALKIVGYLSPRELCTASLVCRKWRRLCETNEIWHDLVKRVDISLPMPENPVWKRVYQDMFGINENWQVGRCSHMDLRGHKQKVLSLTFDNERLATGSLDKTIKLWRLKDGKLLKTLRGHERGVWCLRFYTKTILVSGSYDQSIMVSCGMSFEQIWNLGAWKLARTIPAHVGPVWALAHSEGIFVSGSQDTTAKIWDLNNFRLVHVLRGHSLPVFAVDICVDDNIVFTGSADRSVRIWSLDLGECARIVWPSPTTSIMTVSYDDGYVACAFGTTIKIYHVNKTLPISTFEDAHYRRIECVQLKITDGKLGEGTLMSGSKDGRVKYWDIKQDHALRTFSGHADKQVNCLLFDELRVATAGYDNKVRIYNFSSL